MQTLIKERSEVLQRMQEQVKIDVQQIKCKAEHMVECATQISGHGYRSFIESREDFLKELNRFTEDYVALIIPFR